MKRLSLYLFLILFTFQTSSWSDDIRDFEIEGMSIGDSLLDYVTKDEIEKGKRYYPNSKKWAMFAKSDSSLKTYDAFQVHIKDKDNKYIIGTVDGHIFYENNIEDCYKKLDEIEIEVSEIFKEADKERTKTKHDLDKSGKSIVTGVVYWFKSGDIAKIACSDWSSEMDRTDKLVIKMGTKEFIDWINNEAYD